MNQFKLDEAAKGALRHLVWRELDELVDRARKVGFDCEETLAMLTAALVERARQKAEASFAGESTEQPVPYCRH